MTVFVVAILALLANCQRIAAHCSIWQILRSKFQHDFFSILSIKIVNLLIIIIVNLISNAKVKNVFGKKSYFDGSFLEIEQCVQWCNVGSPLPLEDACSQLVNLKRTQGALVN